MEEFQKDRKIHGRISTSFIFSGRWQAVATISPGNDSPRLID